MEQGTSPTYSTATAAPPGTCGNILGGENSWDIARNTSPWLWSAEQLPIPLLHP